MNLTRRQERRLIRQEEELNIPRTKLLENLLEMEREENEATRPITQY